jgi:hypothetical protein
MRHFELESLETRRLHCASHASESGAHEPAAFLRAAALTPAALPDLVPIRTQGAYQEQLDLTSHPGRALLRFGTAFG